MTRKRKFSKCHFLRIFLFAQHLETCRLEDYPMENYWKNHGQRAPYIIDYNGRFIFLTFPYVIRELIIFSEWEWIKECGLIVYKKNMHLYTTTEQGVVDFFGLTNAEYCRYMIPLGHKNSSLHLHSTPKEVAYGLYELIGVTKRFVMVEKFQARNT
jgi:hypothetical protein